MSIQSASVIVKTKTSHEQLLCINLSTPSFSFSSHFLPLFFKCLWLVASNLTFTCVCVDKTLHGTSSKFLIQKNSDDDEARYNDLKKKSQIQWQLKITIVTIVSISQQISNSVQLWEGNSSHIVGKCWRVQFETGSEFLQNFFVSWHCG